MGIENSYVWDSPNGPLVPASPLSAPDTMPAWTPLGGVNETNAGNNHGYAPTHNQDTHADGVPTGEAIPTGYNDDSNGQG